MTVACIAGLLLTAVACGSDAVEFPASGLVSAGPTCPLETDPPDPDCADRPVPGAVLVVLDANGDQVAEVRSNDSGRFQFRLPAGQYKLVPQPVAGLLGTAPDEPFELGAGLAPIFAVRYDTGIR